MKKPKRCMNTILWRNNVREVGLSDYELITNDHSGSVFHVRKCVNKTKQKPLVYFIRTNMFLSSHDSTYQLYEKQFVTFLLAPVKYPLRLLRIYKNCITLFSERLTEFNLNKLRWNYLHPPQFNIKSSNSA